jgi:hypothetical protein
MRGKEKLLFAYANFQLHFILIDLPFPMIRRLLYNCQALLSFLAVDLELLKQYRK